METDKLNLGEEKNVRIVCIDFQTEPHKPEKLYATFLDKQIKYYLRC
jgi:hypothetical protein